MKYLEMRKNRNKIILYNIILHYIYVHREKPVHLAIYHAFIILAVLYVVGA